MHYDSLQTIDLTGSWTLSNAGKSVEIPARVPGDNFSALLEAGKIPDPYWGENELEVQWVRLEAWTYQREFEVPATLLECASIFLNADTLDTFATVTLNGREVARTENAFLRYRFEVKPFLREGKNVISIEFASPEKRAQAAAKELSYSIPLWTYSPFSSHRNLLRKSQCHAGWDWGICLQVSGIFGPIYLAGVARGRIEHVYTSQRHLAGGAVDVEVTCEVESPAGGETQLEITLGETGLCETIALQPGLNLLCRTVRVESPRLWWPNDYGEAALYPLAVRVAGDEVRKRIGLRKLEVVNQEDKYGASLYFVVNGVPVYCKGASWIPADALPQRQTRAVLADLLESARKAHMNMIRVWGGGQYETEDFYELCDEKGLLVWQDFMFACALYPASKAFLASVKREVVYQVKRLRDHPSIALWCGNNENVGALNWFQEAKTNRDRYVIDYDRLNEGVVGNTVRELDPDRLFWPSSPCGGPDDFSDCWHSDGRGDMHFWSVWHEGKPFEEYLKIRPRFCSEFGYQSFPSLDTIRTYAAPDQWNVTSPVMEHHQRHGRGNTIIVENFTRYFRMPDGFENMVYLSQVQQSLAIQVAVDHFRRCRPVCMGAIYWQLNDLWPVSSWASLNYGGKWKLLHYMAARLFAPVHVSALHTPEGKVEVWGHNDGVEAVAAKLTLRLLDFQGATLWHQALDTELEAGSARRLTELNRAEVLPDVCGGFLAIEMEAVGQTLHETCFFTEYKKCPLAEARPVAEVRAEGEGFEVTLTTDAPAIWLAVDAEGVAGEFDDNLFTLLPDRPRALRFTPKGSVSLEAFRKALRIRHLRGTHR